MRERSRRARNDFLKEKLVRVKKALQQLKKDKRIKDFLRTGPFSFAKRRRIDFYVTYVNGVRYVGRSISIARNHGKQNNKSCIKISLFDGQSTIERKILETIKRL